MTCLHVRRARAAGSVLVLAAGLLTPRRLDASFGVSGRATTALAGVATSVVLQPDGKLVAAGFLSNGPSSSHFVLVRYGTEGLLDPSFGTGGVVTTTFPGSDSSIALAVALQPDGKLLAAGAVTSGALSDFGLARYDADGALDPSFGSGGLVTTDFASGSDQARHLVVQSDGRIVAAGFARTGTAFGPGDFALARYAADGTLDASFGTGGRVTTSFGGDAAAFALVLQPDGKLVAAGEAVDDFALARYDANGGLDPGFGSGGTVTTAFPGATPGSTAEALVLQPDGKLVAAGLKGLGIDLGADFALARYDGGGTLDGTFGSGGLVTTDFAGSYDEASGLVLQPDGKLVAAGRAFIATGSEFASARYAADGTLDPSFGVGGIATTDGGGIYDGALALVVQSDGKLVAAGAIDRPSIGYELALLRSNPDGSRDACAAAPEPGCRTSLHSLLTLTQNGPNHVSHLGWQWREGAATTVADFGAPDQTSGYQLCLYDPSGARLGIGVNAGGVCDGKPCWRSTPSGFTYRDKTLVPDGVFQLLLRAGADGKARVSLVGKGDRLALPLPPFASFPLTVQVKRPDGGECWEATYATALQNEPGRLKAKR